jgi:hypothetical protein
MAGVAARRAWQAGGAPCFSLGAWRAAIGAGAAGELQRAHDHQSHFDRSMAAILREFLDVETDVVPIEEPAEKPTRHYRANWEMNAGTAGIRESFGKVSTASAS